MKKNIILKVSKGLALLAWMYNFDKGDSFNNRYKNNFSNFS